MEELKRLYEIAEKSCETDEEIMDLNVLYCKVNEKLELLDALTSFVGIRLEAARIANSGYDNKNDCYRENTLNPEKKKILKDWVER